MASGEVVADAEAVDAFVDGLEGADAFGAGGEDDGGASVSKQGPRGEELGGL